MSSVLWLEHITLDQHDRVGNKAATLGTLKRAGLPVPDGFCVPVDVSPRNIDAHWDAIISAYGQLTSGEGAVVVRSSGVAEDSPEASFAGLYESVLNVQGADALRSAMERCWQAARSPRVQAYRNGRGTAGADSQLSLIIQRQVPATVSGVLFTSDPVSDSREEMLIEAVAGPGEALLSGHASPTRYRVSREGRFWAPSSQELLTPVQGRELAELGSRIEDILGPGQDIEWAITASRTYILQARPISKIRMGLSPSQVWTRANIGEVLPDVVTPLTWSIFQATLLNNPSVALGELSNRTHRSEGIRLIHGRAYIRLDSLLDSFCYLPTVTPEIMDRALGVSTPSAAQPYTRPAGLSVRLAQSMFILDALGVVPRLSWMSRRMAPLPPATLKKLPGLVTWAARCFQLHLKCTAYAIGTLGLTTYFLGRWSPEEADALLPQVLTGQPDLQTATQGISLWRLARRVSRNPHLREVLKAGYSWSITSQHFADIEEGPDFLNDLRLFLEANGHRAAGEFELAVPRWREDPTFVLEVLRNFLEVEDRKLSNALMERRQQRREAIARVNASLTQPEKWVFGRLLNSHSRYVTLRENMKHRLITGYAQLRSVFCQIGADLANKGILEDPNDVFFLTSAEALALEADDRDVPAKQNLIQVRKAEYTRQQSHIAPELVVRDGEEISSLQHEGLNGIGCSPGTAEGLARVLFDVSEAGCLRPGEILVAPHTDPGWTPLFLSCAGVITERGGYLSHGATVAREYGIPAVVNVEGATTQIQTGDLVRVDGFSGRVVICSEGDGPQK